MRSALVAVMLIRCYATAATIDQIAVTVRNQVITESQIDEEIRITALLNQAPAEHSLEVRRAAAARLVDQTLIREEISLTRYPAPDEATVEEALARVEGLYGTPEAFTEALHSLQIDESEVRQHLATQIATLRFVAFRFRPDAGISDSDIEEYYQHELASRVASAPKKPVPNLAASRSNIRRTLIEQRTDEALDDWLRRARKESRIVFLDKSLLEAAK